MEAEHTLAASRLGASVHAVPRLSRRAGFWAIAFAFLSVTALSTAPSALYGLYERREHFSPITVTLVYAVYAAGVIASLLLAGHVSDWYGRKAVLIPALTLAVAAAALFISWQSLTGLLVARVITGLALGATVATATAYIADLDSDPTRPDAAVTRHAGERRGWVMKWAGEEPAGQSSEQSPTGKGQRGAGDRREELASGVGRHLETLRPVPREWVRGWASLGRERDAEHRHKERRK